MKNEKNTISFMFPVTSGIMGGVQMLLINLIPHIIKNGLANVRLYDYTFGLVKLELDKLGVEDYEFISLDSSKWTIPNLGDETFVLTGGLWLTYPKFFENKKNVKLAVWDVYYPFWSTLGSFKGLKIPFLRAGLMSDLAEKDAVFFMEEKGLQVFKEEGYYSNKSNESIVPLPVYIKDKNIYLKDYSPATESKFNIAYIGRAEDWKMYPVKKIIEDLAVLNTECQLLVYTNDKNFFAKFLGKLPVNVSVDYKVGYSGEKLEQDLIKNKVAFGYSMGTAALDMAKLGIPVILADFSYEEFPKKYYYKLLHHTGLGNLGENAAEVKFGQRLSLAEILDLEKKEWSGLSYSFVCDKHSIDVCSERLIIAVNQTRLNINEVSKLKYIPHFLYYLYKRNFNSDEKFFGWGIK